MKNKAKFLLATLTGAVGGAIAGLLMAPGKGSSTRKKIAQESEKYLREIKDNLEALRRDLNNKAKSTKADIDRFGKDARGKGDDILDRAKKITSYEEWTKDELYDRAKELEIEGRSKMDKEELIEALRNH